MLLAIETATTACSVAIQHQGHMVSRHLEQARVHNHELLPSIQALLAEADAELSQLERIIYGNGPGSFVGVRIAAGVVQGLAYGLDIPVQPMSTLQAIAQTAYEQQGIASCLVALDARLNQVYAQDFALDATTQCMQPLHEAWVSEPSALANHLTDDMQAIGDGWMLPDSPQSGHIILPHATALLSLANAYPEARLPQQAQPIYLRVTQPWRKQNAQ